jgi:hypothetical protein
MSFASASRPAIGVSLLKSALNNIEISSVIHYFDLKFAERVTNLYNKVAEHEYAGSSLIGELIFKCPTLQSSSRQKQDLVSVICNIFDKLHDQCAEKNQLEP